MPGEEADGFNLDDRDRLPWLEPAQEMDEPRAVPMQKLVALVLLGLGLLGLIVGGGWCLKSRSQNATTGEIALIPAAGPYKIPAPDPKAKEFAGEGDESYKASEGGDSNSRIDPGKAPEQPITDLADAPAAAPKAPTPAPTKPVLRREASKPIKDDAGRAAAPIAAAPPLASAPSTLTGARVQLGAYNSDAIAQAAWKRLGERFTELAGAAHAVEPITSRGHMLFRLRMSAASTSEASAICGKLRVAGESCWVVP